MNGRYNLPAILLTITLMLAAAGTGFYFGKKSKSVKEPSTVVQREDSHEIREGGYRFISPLLECEQYLPSILSANQNIEASVRSYISQQINQGKAQHVSVYFRDLNNGPWIGIAEDEMYSPASLLKVPIMIAALKKAEADTSFLHEEFRYEEAMGDTFLQTISDGKTLEPGKKYSIEFLLKRMIAYSDNRAKNLLVVTLGIPLLQKTLEDIQLKVSGSLQPNDICSVREYSSFFRVLYNASYLNKAMSERALQILSESTFKSGLVAELPTDVVVAHKFGERGQAGSGNVQLHDCGIVYTKSPYLICIMTRGKDSGNLAKIISEISLMVYQQRTAN